METIGKQSVLRRDFTEVLDLLTVFLDKMEPIKGGKPDGWKRNDEMYHLGHAKGHIESILSGELFDDQTGFPHEFHLVFRAIAAAQKRLNRDRQDTRLWPDRPTQGA